MKDRIYNQLTERCSKGRKMLCVLIDPDKYNENSLHDLVRTAQSNNVHYFFVGGSLMTSDRFEQTIELVKATCDIPVILFPGSAMQISSKADAILFLSLISGRNPEYLIGQQVLAAPYVRKADIEVLPTGYMLIESQNNTTANYISNTLPIPKDKADIAATTAMAGEMLGLKLCYMDGGSGAGESISASMISEVKRSISTPLIVGGGITKSQQARELWAAGADILVVGNAIEKDVELINELSRELGTFV
ncbi:MAG: geranylgeranylglyceryl/heptaprenylglyceryl phosphate synthase [Vicingaceae bacterium]